MILRSMQSGWVGITYSYHSRVLLGKVRMTILLVILGGLKSVRVAPWYELLSSVKIQGWVNRYNRSRF
jgi:hypothetical protein